MQPRELGRIQGPEGEAIDDQRLIADVESGGPAEPPLDQLYAWWGTHS